MYHVFIIHSLPKGRLGCFKFLARVKESHCRTSIYGEGSLALGFIILSQLWHFIAAIENGKNGFQGKPVLRTLLGIL